MGGDKKGDKKGDGKKSQGEFGKGGDGYSDKKGDKGDFSASGKKGGDKKGDSKKGGDKKGGGKGGGTTAKVPLNFPPPLGSSVKCDTYIAPYLFTEKAPSMRTQGIVKGEGAQEQQDKDRGSFTDHMGRVPRLAPGTKGADLDLAVNEVPVQFEANRRFYQYSMQGIKGSDEPGDGKIIDRKKERRALRILLASTDQATADPELSFVPASGGILFTNKPLKPDGDDDLATTLVRVPTGQEKSDFAKQTFTAKFKKTREITMTSITQEVITLISAIFRDCMEAQVVVDEGGWQKIGRTYFNMSKAVDIPRMNKSLVPGLYTTLHVADCGHGLSMTMDCVKKCMASKNAWDEIREARGLPAQPDLRQPAVQRTLKQAWEDCVMMTDYSARDFRKPTVHIDDILFSEDETTKQEQLGGKSLKEYFEEHYQLKVPPGQPVLVCKNRRRRDPKTGEPMVEKYLPSVLKMTGCPPRDPKTKPIREQMLKMCAVRPAERYETIKSMLIGIIGPKSAWAKVAPLWGLSLAKGFTKMKGRSMPKPTLLMAKGWKKSTEEGSWNFDLIKKGNNPNPPTSCFELPHPPKTGIICLVPKGAAGAWRGPDERSSPSENLIKWTRHLAGGPVNFKNVDIKTMSGENGAEVAQKMAEFKTADGYFVCADTQANDNEGGYKAVKIESIIQQGKPSQVVREKTVQDGRKVYAVSIKCATQMLTKMGASIWAIDGLKFPDTMVVGISFHHAGSAEGRRSQGSVAGIAASLNDSMSRYCMKECQLDPGRTVADQLGQEFRKCLQKYKENNGKPPQNFIFYREGGSEGEVPSIVIEEVTNIKEAIKDATGGKGRMAYFLVIRASHVRMVARTDLEGQNEYKLENPQFGAIVDTSITHMCAWEFYLVSQKVDQGCATAVKYKNLINELGDWDADRFQELSFNLCNMYYNWNGPIAVPAPCLYASRHARMFGDQLCDATGAPLQINASSAIHKNDCIPCL